MAGVADAAVTRGATVSSQTLSATTTNCDISHTVDSGTTLLIVDLAIEGNISVSTAQWSLGGGENLTLIQTTGTAGAAENRVHTYGLVSPTSGAGTVTLTIGSTDNCGAVAVNYIGTNTDSVAAATNVLSQDDNPTTGETATNVHASGGTAGNALHLFTSIRGADGDPVSNASSYTELFENETGGGSTTSDSVLYVADLLDGAPSAVTATFSVTDNNAGHHIEIVVASTPPTFDSGPTFSAVDSNTARFTYDADATADTIFCGAYPLDATAPTGAQLEAGTGALATATEATTGSSDTLDIDVTENPAFPRYDLYCVLEEGTGNYSSVASMLDSELSAASDCGDASDEACQYVVLTSIGAGGLAAIYDLAYDGQTENFVLGSVCTGGTSMATGQILADTDGGATGTLQILLLSGTFENNDALTCVNLQSESVGAADVNGTATAYFASGDIIVAPAATSPGNEAFSITAAGLGSFDSDGSRDSILNVRFYDVSAEAYEDDSGAGYDYWFYNAVPVCADNSWNLKVGIAVTLNIGTTFCTDADDATLTITRQTDPSITGITFSAPNESGTPTVLSESGTGVYTGTDLPGDFDQMDLVLTVITAGFGVAGAQGVTRGMISMGF